MKVPDAAERTVLVVEDATDFAAVLEVALLGLAGVRVHHAGSAEAAWEALTQGPVAAVLTDLQLPGMSGIELTRKVRSEQRYAGLPVIVVSATADTRAETHALYAGANAFFAKPFSPAVVCRKLRELWGEL